MGLAFDASALIAAECEERPVSQLLTLWQSRHGDDSYFISAVTAMELEHGWRRAKHPEVANKRRRYLDEVFAVLPVEPFSREMGLLAAGIDARMRDGGVVIATADLLIGVTALYHGYSVATRNPQHFQMIPGLSVVLL